MSGAATDIVIIGAGLSGLACARKLARAGKKFTLFEAGNGIGGRVRTDVVDGYRLDRGFQVFLPAYPQARKILDYDALDLRPFYRAADIFYGGRFHRAADPLHHPFQIMRSLNDAAVPWRDKWYTLLLRKEVFCVRKVPRQMKEQATEDYLRDYGFSDMFIDRFFRPFFGGIFTEKELRSSSRMFVYLFSMFDRGGTALPALGMQAIPEQLASFIPPEAIRLNAPVTGVAPQEVTLDSGEVIRAKHIVVATSEEMAARLLPRSGPVKSPAARALTCMYFSTEVKNLPADPILLLDGEGRGPVNHAAILTNVSKDYAPEGRGIVSCSILGAPSSTELESVVREQMTRWFGPSVTSWQHVRTYQIRNAQPESRQLKVGDDEPTALISPGLYRCGDYCEDVSINGALTSGERAANAILESEA
jgi:phytoene dehydrogenase-like protein